MLQNEYFLFLQMTQSNSPSGLVMRDPQGYGYNPVFMEGVYSYGKEKNQPTR